MKPFSALICKFKGHRFGKARNVPNGTMVPTLRVKQCRRCGLEREVKQRKKEAA